MKRRDARHRHSAQQRPELYSGDQINQTDGQSDDRQAKNDMRRRERALAEMETTIHRLEQELAKIEEDLQKASHDQDLARIQRLSDAYSKTQATLEQSMEEWAELAT